MDMMPYDAFAKAIFSNTPPIAETDLNDPDLIDMVKNMGRMGIILPHQIKAKDVCDTLYTYHIMTNNDDFFDRCRQEDANLSKDDFCELAATYLFYRLYEEYDHQYYNAAKNRVETFLNNYYPPMSGFFSQCTKALESEFFYPCVCGLITILEGILGKYVGSSQTSMHSLFDNVIDQITDSTESIVAINIQSFIDTITTRSDFLSQDEPIQLNRHWLLHGRSNRDVTKLDCISILCAIDAVIDLIQHSIGDLP